MTEHEMWMREALEEARQAFNAGEVPVGVVVVHENKCLVRSHNLVETMQDASAHAELLALKKAAAILGRWRLDDVDVYVTVEPCPMCAMAMVLFRVKRLYFGTQEPRTGAAGSFINLASNDALNHRMEVMSGICQAEAATLMKSFFQSRRGGNSNKNSVLDKG